ncbi:hypothetical protein MKEN_00441100 [Mycena kentingensis (nom. inval.)]|nr:hypothetical protein MKEN_00441100 [Mycena kentingensis (nom. inval.)]
MTEPELWNVLRPESTLGPASHHRSRDSAAASTRSWVITNATSPPPSPEVIPVPEPVQSLSSAPRPLPEPPWRTPSALTAEQHAEHMFVEVPSAEMGYQWTTGKVDKAKEAHARRLGTKSSFVGGFVSGLKKLPRVLGRSKRPRRGTEATELSAGTGNTLPQYRSEPPTPIPDQNVTFAMAPQPYRPSFILVPPEEEHQPTSAAVDDEMPGGFGAADNPSTRVGPTRPPTPGIALTRSHSHTPAPSPRPSRAADERLPETASILAHPQPTEDYRRMSAQDAALSRQQSTHSLTTVDDESESSLRSPSFTSELHGPFYRFFNALHMMPWVATDRITVDWKPKPKPRPTLTQGTSWYYPVGMAPASTPGHGTSEIDPMEVRLPPPQTRTHASRHRQTMTAEYPTYTYAPYPAFSHSPPPRSPLPSPIPSPRPARRSRRNSHTQSQLAQTANRRRHHHHRRRPSTNGQYRVPPIDGSANAQWAPLASPHLYHAPAPLYVIQASPVPSEAMPASETGGTAGSPNNSPAPRRMRSPSSLQMLAPVYMQMQVPPATARPGSPTTPAAAVAAGSNGQPSPGPQFQYTTFAPGYGYGYGYGSPVLQMQMATPVSLQHQHQHPHHSTP